MKPTSRAGSFHAIPAPRPAASGFIIGWVSVTLATALVFAVFASPLLGEHYASVLSEDIAIRAGATHP